MGGLVHSCSWFAGESLLPSDERLGATGVALSISVFMMRLLDDQCTGAIQYTGLWLRLPVTGGIYLWWIVYFLDVCACR